MKFNVDLKLKIHLLEKLAIVYFPENVTSAGVLSFTLITCLFFQGLRTTAPPSVRGRQCASVVPSACFLLHSPPLQQTASSHSARSAPLIKVRNNPPLF